VITRIIIIIIIPSIMERDKIFEYPQPHNILHATVTVSRQHLPYADSQGQSVSYYYVFSYKIHPAVLILSAVLTQSINLEKSVQTKIVTS
jgi:hypothetical protein